MSSDKSIAELAYHLWSARGRQHGSAEEDWLEAERRLATAEADRDGAGRDGHDGAGHDVAGHDVAGRNGAIVPSPGETLPASDPAAGKKPNTSSNAKDNWHSVGITPRRDTNPPMDESDDGPTIAPRDIGEG